MNKTLRDASLSSLFLLCFLFITTYANAQTPGLIYKIATNGGNKILDPDGNGYVSKTNLGFQLVGGNRLDEGPDYSEIPYRPFPVFMDELLGDAMPTGSFGDTDFAPKLLNGNGNIIASPMASYFDGKNLLFRIRLASQSSASKGYSILIDTNKSLNGSAPNPGFEFEVLLATNYDVRVYNHSNGGTIIFSGSVDQYSQKAIAGSTGGNDADYFYDFYVPISAFGGSITGATDLRMTGTTVTSTQSSFTGITSDVAGVNDITYKGNAVNAWRDIINNTFTANPDGIKSAGFTQVSSAYAPRINTPVQVGNTNISGSSVEASGSVVYIYENGALIGQTTVSANGSWLLNVASGFLTEGRTITATVKPASKAVSPSSTGILVRAGACRTTAPVISGIANGPTKALVGTTSVAGTIKVYRVGSSTPEYIIANTAANSQWNTPTAVSIGTYYATVTETAAGSCESGMSNQFCYISSQGNGTTYTPSAPSISDNNTLTATTLTINGTATTANTTILISKNGVQIGTTQSAATFSNGSYAWTFTYTIPANQPILVGDVFYARTSVTSPCTAVSGRSGALSVVLNSTAPTITGSYCGTITTVNGTSLEAAGTIITVFVNNIEVGQTTVNSSGAWSATIPSRTAGTITATATAPNKVVSTASTDVPINTTYTASPLVITGDAADATIKEGSNTVKGNAPAGSLVTLYINGAPYLDRNGNKITAPATGGTFLFSGISPFELFAGARLTITAKASATSCESAQSVAVIVACNTEDYTGTTASLAAATVCQNSSASVNLSTSKPGIIYNIFKKESNGTYTAFGPSKLGTGSAITLQSDPITVGGTILQVQTINLGANCPNVIGADLTVRIFSPVPGTFTLSANPETAGCANTSVTFTVPAAQTGYSYQLINNETQEKIGSPLAPTVNGDLTFPAVIVPKTTTYGVLITGTISGCVPNNTILKTVTITGGPDVTKSVTSSQTIVCAGSAVSVSVATENGNTYKLYQEGNATELASFTGNGNTIAINLSAPFITTGTKIIYATVTGGGCTNLRMTQTATITVTNSTAGTVSAGSNATVCGSTYTLAGSNPETGSGTWTLVSKPALASDPVFTDATSPNTAVTGLQSGEYRFNWSVTSACNGVPTGSTVTISVNCPAEYIVRSTRFVDDYINNEVLATVSDSDGIKSVQVVANKGGLPFGTALDSSTGTISVLNINELKAGNYTFTIRVTDKFDKITDIPLFIRFYSMSLRPVDITPLPVELVSFTATTTLSGVLLNWMTASELDNDRFEIERSGDGKLFSQIGVVNGNGTSNRKIKYSFTDTKPLPEVSYYRLKQVDFDGTHKYSKIISVKNKALSATTILEAYPNPFFRELTVTITVPAPEEASLTLYNLQGRQLHTIKTTLEKGMNTYDLDMQQLASGIYIIRITGNNSDISAKVLKK